MTERQRLESMRRISPDLLTIGAIASFTGLFLLHLLMLSHQITLTESRIERELTRQKDVFPVNLSNLGILSRSDPPVAACLGACRSLPPPFINGHWAIPALNKPSDNEQSRLFLTINPKPITKIDPIYPERAKHIYGYVDFEFTIETDGAVGDPKIIGEVPEGYGFAASALKVFPNWKFVPIEVDGRTVKAKARYRMVFSPYP